MKKLGILSLALLLGASAYAEEISIIALSGKDVPGAPEEMKIGTCALGISPNGQYLCGVLENAVAIFVSDWQKNEIKWMFANDDAGGELRNVNNQGIAVGFDGPGITYSFTTGEQTPLPVPTGVRSILGQAITNDGNIIAGSLVVDSFQTKAAVKKEGQDWQFLPIPSDEELGEYYAKEAAMGSGVQCISGDGKVVYGYLGNFGIPMLWMMNENGEYEADMFLQKYTKFSAEDFEDESKPFLNATKMAMYGLSLSNNGKYLTCRCIKGDSLDTAYGVAVVYDTETKELTIYDEDQPADVTGWGLYPTAICDNGTFIGSFGPTSTSSAGSFIMEHGTKQAKSYREAFPEYDKVLGEGDSYGFFVPTGISASGRYVSGYGFYATDYMDADSEEYYASYVIDRGEEYEKAGVNAIAAESSAATPVAFYSIDGKQVKTPAKGINIIRMSDGSSRKVMVK